MYRSAKEEAIRIRRTVIVVAVLCLLAGILTGQLEFVRCEYQAPLWPYLPSDASFLAIVSTPNPSYLPGY